MKLPLKPIKPKRVSDQVFDQLKELIFRGAVKAGEQIMPERELAAALNVSRTSVRDAISKLVVMGLLEQRQGQGTFIRSLDSLQNNPLAAALDAHDATLVDLLEVRMGLECNAAALAAQRAVANDLQFLDRSIADMRLEVAAGKLGTEADVAFHMAIAYATKNPVHVDIMKSFYDFLFIGIKENLAHLYQKPGNIAKILEQHTAIYHAIRDHDADQAYRSMKRHIGFVLNFFKNKIV